MSSKALAIAIYNLGVTDNDFNTAIGGSDVLAGRFLPEGFKKDEVPVKPYAHYRILGMVGQDQFRVNIERALIQIKCYSAFVDPSEAYEITEKAFQLFHKTELTVTGSIGVQLFRVNVIPAMREGDFWTSSIDFRTLIQEN